MKMSWREISLDNLFRTLGHKLSRPTDFKMFILHWSCLKPCLVTNGLRTEFIVLTQYKCDILLLSKCRNIKIFDFSILLLAKNLLHQSRRGPLSLQWHSYDVGKAKQFSLWRKIKEKKKNSQIQIFFSLSTIFSIRISFHYLSSLAPCPFIVCLNGQRHSIHIVWTSHHLLQSDFSKSKPKCKDREQYCATDTCKCIP